MVVSFLWRNFVVEIWQIVNYTSNENGLCLLQPYQSSFGWEI